MTMLVLYLVNLVNWGFNSFLERLAWFIKKPKQFNWEPYCNIGSDIAALTMTLSVNGPLFPS